MHGADGRLRWVCSIGHPRLMPDGSVVWDGIALDVSARRETEAALERMVELAREAEAAQSMLVTGEGGRVGRSLAAISRHLDALATSVPGHAVQHVHAVRAELSALLQTEQEPAGSTLLTKRQREVLSLLEQGASNRDIGKRLGIDPGTAKIHVAAILKRLAAANRTAAVTAGRKAGLV